MQINNTTSVRYVQFSLWLYAVDLSLSCPVVTLRCRERMQVKPNFLTRALAQASMLLNPFYIPVSSVQESPGFCVCMTLLCMCFAICVRVGFCL